MDAAHTILAVLRRRSPHARHLDLAADTRLIRDLGFDSVTLVEVMLEIEDETGVRYEASVLSNPDVSVGDLLPS